VDGGKGGGPLSDETDLSFTDSNGVTSKYHRYAAGLDWSKRVGLIIYTDGTGEYGLKNPRSSYLLGGTNGLVQVAKRNNMVLLTPLAPGVGCTDSDSTCWYQTSSGYTPAAKARWSAELAQHVENQYATDPARVAFGGYSSGAQWTTQFFGPVHAANLMTAGVAVAISYGSPPYGTTNLPAAFKANVAFTWDTGDADPGGYPAAQNGYNWYTKNGFRTKITVLPGKTHTRSGEFGGIVEREIKEHLLPP